MVDASEFSAHGRNYLIIDMNFLETEVKLLKFSTLAF